MPPKSEKSPEEFSQDYVKYSSMGFQMLAMIGLGVWAGWSLDNYLNYKIPIYTVIFSLGSVIGSLVYFIRSIIKN